MRWIETPSGTSPTSRFETLRPCLTSPHIYSACSALIDIGAGWGADLDGGRALGFAGLFLAPKSRVAGNLAQSLGCELEETPFASFIKTDVMKATSVPGVFARGDAAMAAGSASFAIGDGARAGLAAHRSLIFR